jgi:predicted XRE-type DNA-binding protein
MKTTTTTNPHRGSDFHEFLASEGLLAEAEILALKKAVAIQLQEAIGQEHITKKQLAERMKTSRAALDRILDPTNPSLTVASLGKAAAALGRKVELRLVPVQV